MYAACGICYDGAAIANFANATMFPQFRLSIVSSAGPRLIAVSLLALGTAACRHGSTTINLEDHEPPTTVPCCQYTLAGGIPRPGPRTLLPGDTVSTVLSRDFPFAPGKPTTVVLIRQAPEGKTKQLIQLNADGRLMDAKQDYALRNGDELLFAGGPESNAAPAPPGPPPRTAE